MANLITGDAMTLDLRIAVLPPAVSAALAATWPSRSGCSWPGGLASGVFPWSRQPRAPRRRSSCARRRPGGGRLADDGGDADAGSLVRQDDDGPAGGAGRRRAHPDAAQPRVVRWSGFVELWVTSAVVGAGQLAVLVAGQADR